ncbi:hypothetical protein BH09BAC1_BH09BAC1_18790 [soil metagenome]
MKKLIFTLVVAFYAVSAFAQGSNYIFFAEQGEKFYVIINGIRQNEEPQTNVKVANVNAMMLKVKIIFADKALGEIDKTLPAPESPSEITWNVRKDKNGKFVVKWMGDVPIAQAPPTPPTATVVTYTTTPAPAATTVTHSTTTTAVGTPVVTSGVNVNVGVGVPGVGMNVTINDGTGYYYEEDTSVTTTTTTTTTNTPAPTPVPSQPPVYVMPGYNGPVGCPWPMSDADFASAKASIKKQSFSDSQFAIAQQIFNSNCLTSAQVKEIMLIFSFEATRLDFAKYAYGRTFDLGNYYKVNDAFTFSTSVDELNAYISSNRR